VSVASHTADGGFRVHYDVGATGAEALRSLLVARFGEGSARAEPASLGAWRVVAAHRFEVRWSPTGGVTLLLRFGATQAQRDADRQCLEALIARDRARREAA
jgi:hypothetical protein